MYNSSSRQGRSINSNDELETALAFLAQKPRIAVLTGAGISAGCGIPTYRDTAGIWQRSQPIQHQDFLSSSSARSRYWQRSYAGWPAVADALPSASHRALVALQRQGRLSCLVTQNVDGLHQRAGHADVVDLHGRLDEVVCLDCMALSSRAALQARLEALNPALMAVGRIAPDGDADVELVASFEIPVCERCGGTLKPNVVFFGGSVDKRKVDRVYQAIRASDILVVIGSSLQVFSGYRFCRFAKEQQIPMMSINPGASRADDIFDLRLKVTADELVPQLADRLLRNS